MRAAAPVMPAALARFPVGTLVKAALLAAAATLYGLILLQALGRHQDFDTYLTAARDLLQGRPLYGVFLHHPFPDPTLRPAFIYPPAFALLVAPLSLLPDGISAGAWLLMMQAALGGAAILILRSLRPGTAVSTGIAALTLTFFPLWVDAIQGQANLLILLLTVAGIVGVLHGRSYAGLALGAAAALKLVPLLLLGWLLLERRWRALGYMLGGAALLTAAGAAIRPDDTLTFLTRVLPQLSKGTGFYDNQSVNGVLTRLFSANPYAQPWFVFPWEPALLAALAIALAGFWLLRSRGLSGLDRALSALPLLPLLSSVTWEHHLVVLLPLLWLVLDRLHRLAWPRAQTATFGLILAGFSVVARWHPGPAFSAPGFRSAQTADPLVLLTANSLFLTTLALFLLSPWLLRSR
jgi:alpha-1,2-mannosyltransferase